MIDRGLVDAVFERETIIQNSVICVFSYSYYSQLPIQDSARDQRRGFTRTLE